MTPHLRDEAQWAVEVGERLRTLHASFADDDPTGRREYLRDELQRALQSIPAARKRTYLEALAERFPTGAIAAPEPVPTPPPPAQVPESAESLVSRLAELASQLPEPERVALSYKLQQAGFSVVIPAAAPGQQMTIEEIHPELQKKLGLDPGQPLDRQRALKLAAGMLDLVVTMDQLAWNLWKNLAPNSIVRRDPGPTGDLRKLAGPYIIGDNEVSTAQITQLLDKTRQLIAALLAAVGSIGETFARQYLARFSPHSIKEMADADPGFFIGPEQKCWRKYLQLFNDVNGLTIENEIAAAIAKYTEDLILGANRGGSTTTATKG
jgi:hypothetical protein